MGYRSTVVIGVDKTILARHLITQEIPNSLMELEYTTVGNQVYWSIEDWKWYNSYPEIATIESWFMDLSEEQDAKDPEDPIPYIFGAMRIGEDDEDVERWGDPEQLNICLCRSIDYPRNHGS